MKTDFPDLSEINPNTNIQLTKGKVQSSQEMVNTKDPLLQEIKETASTKKKHEIDPDLYEVTNKTFMKFFFPKAFQHGICALLLYFEPEISQFLVKYIELKTFSIIVGCISGFLILLCFGIIKGCFVNSDAIPKIIMFFCYFFTALSINAIIFIGSLYLDYKYKLYIPFLYISGICLIIGIVLIFVIGSYVAVSNAFLVLGILCASYWLILVKGIGLAFTLVISISTLFHYAIFTVRTQNSIKNGDFTSAIKYNTIFYNSFVSIYLFLLAILIIATGLILFLLIGFCLGAAGCENVSCGNQGKNCNCFICYLFIKN